MATTFKKPRRNFRRKVATSDSDEENNDAEKKEEIIKEPVNNGDSEPKTKHKKKRETSSLLSFADAEDDDAEIFQIKKSSHSKRIAKQLKKESLKEKEERKKEEIEATPKPPSPTPVKVAPIVNTEEKLRQLREELCTLNGDEAVALEEPESDEETPKDRKMLQAVLKKGEIPDATMIHMIRKSRQMAREMGDFIPVDEAGAKTENNNSRLVRDDDHDKSDEDDEEGRIDFAVNREARERQKMKDEFLAAEHGSDQEGSDLESGWEEQQIRKAVNIPQVTRDDDLPTKYTLPVVTDKSDPNYAEDQSAFVSETVKSNFQPFSLTSKDSNELTIELIQKKLKERLDSINQVHRSHVNERDTLVINLEDTQKEIEEAEKNCSILEERFKFFQEMRGYVRDLVECLNEKVPTIQELEARMANLLKQRAEKLVLRRQQDVRDQCQDYTANKAKVVIDAAEAKQRRVAEREARRSRRRRARENKDISGHHEGLSSDEEENQSDITKFNSEYAEILRIRQRLFDDVEEDFCELENIRLHFEKWKGENSESYKEAYIGLCLPKLFNPFIRLELIDWNPLQEYAKDFEDCRWYECCAFYGFREYVISAAEDEDNVKLIPSIVEKFLLPIISIDYHTVHGESKNTQSLLKAVVQRIKRTLDDDVFMPLYLKTILENRSSGPAVFFHRQSWSCIKLLGNILSWHRILATKMLHTLALEGLLNRYILLGLQTSPLNNEALQKCSLIASSFPKQWFVDVEGDKTIPLLENFCRFLMYAADNLWKNRNSSKEKEIKEQIRLIGKLLINIHAYDHTSKLSELYGLKI
ncbi:GCFC [Acanthosepion pharaonis]|uniref:GCFC n=1 Tax=Acanthosepion pharaonis TaxID=158019 RepID=A0A812C430_ACAPH|nr:GCFC [Sepia pharaonis]